MADRTVEDRLREEYFELLPEIRRGAEDAEVQITHALLPIARKLNRYHRVVVRSRVKECDSAIAKLRRQQGFGGEFDSEKEYTLTSLKDLAGVRVMAFPRTHLDEVNVILRGDVFPEWTPDPFREGESLGFKYFGFTPASKRVKVEFQVVHLLIGLFWEVEHSALYKPASGLRGVTRLEAMEKKRDEVLRALREFEEEFSRSLDESENH